MSATDSSPYVTIALNMLESKVTLLVEYLIGRKIENKTLWLKVKKILAEFASEEEGTR